MATVINTKEREVTLHEKKESLEQMSSKEQILIVGLICVRYCAFGQ